ncbi:Zn(II)2Cys6 transcription factor [Aspergillus stella-maris]|uniref:Zn(II)2Cys6 transcription factor n=1 Tax=Aspergillus stella-maris TaxID=1810926 RepID=UPI003CCE2029
MGEEVHRRELRHSRQRSFDRSDHFARHIQSHQDLRNFQCPWCPKSFNRGDLLYRHKQIHTRRRDGVQYSARATRACQNCIQSKAKCTDQKPCKRCLSKGLSCETTSRSRKKSKPDQTDTVPSLNADVNANPTPSPSTNPQQIIIDAPDASLGLPGFDPVEFSSSGIDPAYATQPSPDPAFQSMRGYSILESFSLLSDGFEWDSGCFDLDLETLQVLTLPPAQDPAHPDVQPLNHTSPASSRFEFFKRSPWLWAPLRIDHAYAGQENLRVNEDAIASSFGLQERFYFQNSLTAEPVDSACRDRILFMIFNSTKSSSLSLQSLSSATFLDRMAQVYFGWNNLQSTSWIHSASFATTDCTTELLGLIIAAGSTSISIPTVWKMGYALQERSRLSLSASIEADNSRVRELQTMQAYLLWVSMGLWSGFKRNMEIAESFLGAPITMLRRCGSFSRHSYRQAIQPYATDEDDVLHAKWTAWVHQESLKRTALFGLITDHRCSMAYLRPTSSSLTELSCPLPAARDIWQASNATAWREAVLAKPPISDKDVPTWAAIMEDGSLLAGLETHYDTSLIALVIVHGYWSQIWAYHESLRFFRHKTSRTSQARTMLWLSCQQQDLAQCLTASKRDLVTHALDPAQVEIIAEFCLMALNVSPRELQQFAGRLGEEEAEITYQILQQWMNESEFRAAVWHAGQILRLTRTLPLTQLREFSAICLYQASLTLWAYGLLSKCAPPHTSPTIAGSTCAIAEHQSDELQVRLDGPECAATTAFLTLGRGVAGISLGLNKVFCPLTDVETVMRETCDIYRDNFGLDTASLPPLLESLITLMTGLGSISADNLATAFSNIGGS